MSLSVLTAAMMSRRACQMAHRPPAQFLHAILHGLIEKAFQVSADYRKFGDIEFVGW
jgi:hypothetical protein